MSMKVEKSIVTKVTVYSDNGESSTCYFDVETNDENEATFADAEICRQQLELAVECVEEIPHWMIGLDLQDSVNCIYEVLSRHHVLKEVPAYAEQPWKIEARQFYAENKRVAGVKVCRSATGWGLKDALDYCDKHFPRGQ